MILRKKSINFDLWSNTHTNPYATRISIFGNKWSFFETCHFLEGPSVLTRNLVMGQIRVHGLISGWVKKETQFKFWEGGRRQSKRGQRVVNREFRVGSNQRKPQKSKPPSEYTVLCKVCRDTSSCWALLQLEWIWALLGFPLFVAFLRSRVSPLSVGALLPSLPPL